ncbi:hypothetical protein [Streptomyces johnsoniae]|uniref:Uncharacterized protein n=1 Tax=Streptomyces johnsoniae TaxID=3075532 RepID=A0ABU2RWY6_9ACTN|nr:hypothetical protein [Streptomyces sp. DSM 41886]MDT0441261.1 hypothetical protein [Streptomyces sp. DSM 41886]
MPDVHHALGGMEIEPRPDPQADFEDEYMALMLFDLGKEPDAYASLTAANEVYTYVAVDAAVNHDWGTNEERRFAVQERIPLAGPLAVSLRAGLTEMVFGAFEHDSQATAEDQATREYERSLNYYRDVVVTGAVDEALARGDYGLSDEEERAVRNGAKDHFLGSFNNGIDRTGRN